MSLWINFAGGHSVNSPFLESFTCDSHRGGAVVSLTALRLSGYLAFHFSVLNIGRIPSQVHPVRHIARRDKADLLQKCQTCVQPGVCHRTPPLYTLPLVLTNIQRFPLLPDCLVFPQFLFALMNFRGAGAASMAASIILRNSYIGRFDFHINGHTLMTEKHEEFLYYMYSH